LTEGSTGGLEVPDPVARDAEIVKGAGTEIIVPGNGLSERGFCGVPGPDQGGKIAGTLHNLGRLFRR